MIHNKNFFAYFQSQLLRVYTSTSIQDLHHHLTTFHFQSSNTIEDNVFFQRLSADISGSLRDPIEWVWLHAKDIKTGRGKLLSKMNK